MVILLYIIYYSWGLHYYGYDMVLILLWYYYGLGCNGIKILNFIMISRYALASVSGISGMIGIGFGESSSNGLVIEHYNSARFVWNYEQIAWGKKTWDSHEVITTRFRKNGWDLYEVNVSTSEHPGKRLVL